MSKKCLLSFSIEIIPLLLMLTSLHKLIGKNMMVTAIFIIQSLVETLIYC